MELLVALGVVAAVSATTAWRMGGTVIVWSRRCRALGLRAVGDTWHLSHQWLAPAGWQPPLLAGHGASPQLGELLDGHEGKVADVELLVARERVAGGESALIATLVPPEVWWWGHGGLEDGDLPAEARREVEELVEAGGETILVHDGVLAVRAPVTRQPGPDMLAATAALAARLTASLHANDWPVLERTAADRAMR